MEDLKKVHSERWVEKITAKDKNSVSVTVRTADGKKAVFEVSREPMDAYDKAGNE